MWNGDYIPFRYKLTGKQERKRMENIELFHLKHISRNISKLIQLFYL